MTARAGQDQDTMREKALAAAVWDTTLSGIEVGCLIAATAYQPITTRASPTILCFLACTACARLVFCDPVRYGDHAARPLR